MATLHWASDTSGGRAAATAARMGCRGSRRRRRAASLTGIGEGIGGLAEGAFIFVLRNASRSLLLTSGSPEWRFYRAVDRHLCALLGCAVSFTTKNDQCERVKNEWLFTERAR